MSVPNRLFLISACRSMLRLAAARKVRGCGLAVGSPSRFETE